MLVIDASAVVDIVAGATPDPSLLDRVENAEALHAPHLIDVETLHALKGLVRGGIIGADRATEARRGLDDLGLNRYPHTGLVERVWQLRHNFSMYDATYVALAELLDLPLVTTDAKLAKAGGHQATIELYASS